MMAVCGDIHGQYVRYHVTLVGSSVAPAVTDELLFVSSIS